MSGGELNATQIHALLQELGRRLQAADAVNLAYDKYGEHSIPLAAGRDNYLIVVEDALDAAATLKPED